MAFLKSLQTVKEETEKKIPKILNRYMYFQIEQLKRTQLVNQSIRVGNKFPDSELTLHDGSKTTLFNLIDDKPTILSFYRGSWCPYCNFTLMHFDDLLKLQSRPINMVAISPEKPTENELISSNPELQFKVTTDEGNQLSKSLGLTFKLPLMLRIIYRLGGIQLSHSQGNREHELPVPATYLVDSKGVVIKRWIEVDYKKRVSPEKVINAYFNYK
ncbi:MULTISPECIES: peroxiredoxin-like family protein [unclassified Fusibacter]|uniref:peroxiredoxin-like family protein n=1 Tax=unclassified Fusibacter TaxID=2624464 RepID=UPI0010112C89|nr:MULTISPECIES: peroxiredoxin-like family protein [unclassified Fusibacter]MCK8060163.1 AhpC/TSA family protein [Fusibacter sp. A2]NPE22303.1 AhpC/TSA family protein [Fusibacter sp. A1]RXV61076.1 AhpC/TSA family protein [Fusibacter sp. A1]